LPAIEGSERDSTQDWVVPRDAVPTVAELEARIDEAVVIARASEEGIREIGEMAVDAARSARRAAEAAEESARVAAAVKVSASEVAGPAGPVPDLVPPPLSGRSPKSAPPPGRGGEDEPQVEGPEQPALVEEQVQAESTLQPRFEERFRDFSERAERLSGRLRRLCEQPGRPAGSSVGAGRRRGAG
jgi:hypothetical protein